MNSLLPMTRMLDALNGNLEAWRPLETACSLPPRADILENDQEFLILMDMPGVTSENLDLSVEDQTLSVKAEREMPLPEGYEARRRERLDRASFHRSFSLGNAVDVDKIGAKLDQGVLRISLPKSHKVLPRRIQIK